MKHILLLSVAMLLTTGSFASAGNPLNNVDSAIAAAWAIVDQGVSVNLDSEDVFTRDQLEILEVEYRYYSPHRRITVTFMVRSSIIKHERMTSCDTVTLYMDDDGSLRNGIGYGNSEFGMD